MNYDSTLDHAEDDNSTAVLRSEPKDYYKEIMTVDPDLAESIKSIERLTKAIVESENVLFPVSKNSFGKDVYHRTRLGDEVLKSMQFIFGICYNYPIYRFNPYVELFIRHVLERKSENHESIYDLYYSRGCGYWRNKTDVLNECIANLRKEAQGSRFKRIIADYQRGPDKNYKGLVEYINELFERYSKLLVIRIDLHYGADICHAVTYQKAQEDRERFFNNMRSNALFDHLISCTWRLEFGLIKGFHYHMLLFFNGSEVCRDVFKAQKIGEYWRDVITKGQGTYYNCNAEQEEYGEHCGIGMVTYKDAPKRANLLNKVCRYFIKPDYYIRVIEPNVGRTFGRGEMPEPKIDQRGRPRKNRQEGHHRTATY